AVFTSSARSMAAPQFGHLLLAILAFQRLDDRELPGERPRARSRRPKPGAVDGGTGHVLEHRDDLPHLLLRAARAHLDGHAVLRLADELDLQPVALQLAIPRVALLDGGGCLHVSSQTTHRPG